MAVHYRTQGIFLKKSARAEADELFFIYTKDFGRLKILGRAIRKITSKLRAGAELFYLSEIEFIQGKAHKTLTDAILIDKFLNIRKDLAKLRVAYRIAEVLDEVVLKEEKDEKIWTLLQEVFEKLNNSCLPAGRGKLEIIYYYFFWNLASLLGYHPAISNCSMQGREINCDIIKILKIILKKDWQILMRLKLEPNHLKLLENISKWYNNNVVEMFNVKRLS